VGEPSSGTIRDRVVAGRAAVANRVDVASRRGRLGGSSLGAWRVASPRETRRFGGGTRIRTGVQGAIGEYCGPTGGSPSMAG